MVAVKQLLNEWFDGTQTAKRLRDKLNEYLKNLRDSVFKRTLDAPVDAVVDYLEFQGGFGRS